MREAVRLGHLRCAALLAVTAPPAVLEGEGGALDAAATAAAAARETYNAAAAAAGGARRALMSCALYSWGSGTNYQLGTGLNSAEAVPREVAELAGAQIQRLAAAKFHSVAADASGRLFTWGWARGGRLGHEQGTRDRGRSEAAVVLPRRVRALAGMRVTRVAAGKHHTLCVVARQVRTSGERRTGRERPPCAVVI